MQALAAPHRMPWSHSCASHLWATSYPITRLFGASQGGRLAILRGSLSLFANCLCGSRHFHGYHCRPPLGDASNPQTRAYWIQAIRNRWVLAFVGGPPCETWSSARGHAVDVEDERSSPRIIRDLEQLWGFDATTLREVSQLIVGNTFSASLFGL